MANTAQHALIRTPTETTLYIARLEHINQDLLAALEAMLERYADDPTLDSPLDERARAAIAKAKGQA